MSIRYALLVFVFFISLCGFFFTSFYNEAKQESIKKLNIEQMLYARQAARTIEGFFAGWTTVLTTLSRTSHIKNMDATGKESIERLYEDNSELIRAITRVDARGRIIYTVPYDRNSIGKDISYQKHIREIMRTHKPVVSDVFFAVQGYRTIALHVPVFKNKSYAGTICITVNFESLAKRHLEAIKIGQTGYAWITSRDGTELFCPVPGHTGNSVFENCKDFPSILTMAEEMLKGHEGTTIYSFDKIRKDSVETIKKHAIYMPIVIGNSFWSIVVASSEDEILSSLKGFRNRLIIIICFILLGGLLFSFYWSKALFIIREEEKRRRVEKALKESEEKYRNIFENAVMGIFQTTPEGRYLSVNPAGAKIYGYESPEDMMQSVSDLSSQIYVNPEDRRRFKEILVVKGYAEGFESEHFRKDGSRIWTSINARAVYDASGVIHYYETTCEDITEHKRLESQLLQSRKMEAIGTLAGGIAHDFNNILSAIMGYTSLLLMKIRKDDPFYSYLKQILLSTEKAASLTQSLLAFSRKQFINPKPLDLNETIAKLSNLLSRLITEDIELKIVYEFEKLIIMADPGQIDQIILNLATNARDAMPHGGTLTISTKKVILDAQFKSIHGFGTTGDFAAISVTDTGPGIDAKTKEKIFEPFFTTKEVGKGTGLGLSIIYGIVEQHSGFIDVSSELNHGTTFIVYLPLSEKEIEKNTELPKNVLRGTETILLAEDNTDLRNLSKTVLENNGYTVIEAVDGSDAIAKFLEHVPDFIILDVVMPKKNGKLVYDEVKRENPGIKVLFTSGYTDDIIHQKGIIEEGLNFISKPFSPHDLLQTIRRILDKK